jgi:glutathione S-transferase
MLTLVGDSFRISPYVFSCFCALREKSIPFEMTELNLEKKAHLRPEYAADTITARVPALAHDGYWIAESLAILEYVEEAFPSPKHPRILPDGIKDRARARQVMSWLRSDDTLGLRDERPTTTMFYEPSTTPLSPRGQASADKLIAVASRLVGDGRPTLFDAWCIADADLAFMLHRLLLNGHDVPAPVRAYAEGQWTRPSVREFTQQKRAPYVPS